VLNVIKYEDLRDIVLVGHSYGGMVATGVADRARDKVRQLIYVDAFVPGDGQSLLDLNRGGGAADAGTAQVRRRLARAAEPDAAGLPRRPMSNGSRAPRRHADQMFRDQAQAAGGPLTLPRSYIYATRITPADTFGPFARMTKNDPAWSYYEIDASHSPNVTAPEALMALLQKICVSD
jgi:pimeloyl-ACP methyl ester carboxylesterase